MLYFIGIKATNSALINHAIDIIALKSSCAPRPRNYQSMELSSERYETIL